ncbi:unnamed protein product [Heligmosomoides polygyrus]|uniref:FAD_binding_2 domain-containing protein n=1 Tax=Heligmosomoides polygyrus TaxID=6339 RepID=A0A183F3X3_HELPZ|nr:unnamed protein product [Heligmosomoides polygyrus]
MAEPASEEDALHSSASSGQVPDSVNCDTCKVERSCAEQSSTDEAQSEQRIACPYEPIRVEYLEQSLQQCYRNRHGFLLFACLHFQGTNKFAKSVDGAPSPDEPVIIVGGGLAGLSAAIEALGRNSKVLIIDSEKNLGGNSAKASSGISACGTETQKKMGIHDSRDRFYMDTVNAGDRENDEALVDMLVRNGSFCLY